MGQNKYWQGETEADNSLNSNKQFHMIHIYFSLHDRNNQIERALPSSGDKYYEDPRQAQNTLGA